MSELARCEKSGDGLPRRCAPRNDGELGIDKRWKAGIMKIRRGAAGRREPLGSYKVTAKRAGLVAVTSFLR